MNMNDSPPLPFHSGDPSVSENGSTSGLHSEKGQVIQISHTDIVRTSA